VVIGVAVPDRDRVRGDETAKSSNSGDSDFRFRGVTVPEVARDKCLFSRKERTSLSRMDWYNSFCSFVRGA